MDADLDTLATALYVRIDDALKDDPSLAPWRPAVGIEPRLTDAELATVAVLQALLGFTSETRGCATPATIWFVCSPICPASPDTTGGCERHRGCSRR
jgi:hypothetical protein